MKIWQKTGVILLAGTFALSMAGCSNEKEINQLAYRTYGINCLEAGNYEEAVDAFQKALNQSVGKVSDTEVDICLYKAKAQYLSGDSEGAINTYTALIEFDGNAKAYYLRGNLYYSMGNDGQGEKDFQSALKEDPDNYALYMGIYETLTSYGENADSYLQDALEIEGESPQDQMQKGRICYLLGDYTQAEELLVKAVEGGMAEGNYYLTEVYEAQGDPASANASFQTYLESGLADSDDLYSIGMLKLQSKDYDKAIRCFEDALDMDEVSNEQSILRNLIIAYEKNGDFTSAKEWMEIYAEEYPEDDSMKDEQIFLETR